VSKPTATELETSVRTKKPECRRPSFNVTGSIPDLTFVDVQFMKHMHDNEKSNEKSRAHGSPGKHGKKPTRRSSTDRRPSTVTEGGSPSKLPSKRSPKKKKKKKAA
jgi:hypothetical protein